MPTFQLASNGEKPRSGWYGSSDGQPTRETRIWRRDLCVPWQNAMRKITFGMLEEAVHRGEIRPDVDLEAASRLINGLMIVVGDSQLLPYLNTYFQITDEKVTPEHILESTVSFIQKGLS